MPKPEPNDAAYYTGLYAGAVVPARLAIERHRWSDAAALPLPAGTFLGGRYSSAEANLYFAQAFGAARMANLEGAREGLQRITSLRDRLLENHDKYSSAQVDIQRESVTAWITFAEGKTDVALSQMRVSADHDDSVDKLPVTQDQSSLLASFSAKCFSK
jgi:hypothetical protein